jgi:hypothetical protein
MVMAILYFQISDGPLEKTLSLKKNKKKIQGLLEDKYNKGLMMMI